MTAEEEGEGEGGQTSEEEQEQEVVGRPGVSELIHSPFAAGHVI